MKVSDKEVEEIQIITEDDELIASITDENIVEKERYKVVCIFPVTEQGPESEEVKGSAREK